LQKVEQLCGRYIGDRLVEDFRRDVLLDRIDPLLAMLRILERRLDPLVVGAGSAQQR
jgi:hypothetical protein